jgi:hypothetical protein
MHSSIATPTSYIAQEIFINHLKIDKEKTLTHKVKPGPMTDISNLALAGEASVRNVQEDCIINKLKIYTATPTFRSGLVIIIKDAIINKL